VKEDKLLKLLKKNLLIATGCTEPASVGLCVSGANSVSKGIFQSIRVVIDPGTYRNASGVIIPGTGEMCGVELAAAIGYFCSDCTKGINIFSDLKEDLVEKAARLVLEDKVDVVIDNSKDRLFIEGLIYTTKGVGRALIVDKHTNMVDRKFYSNQEMESISDVFALRYHNNKEDNFLRGLSISEIYSSVKSLSGDKLIFLREGAEINMKMAKYCMEDRSGYVGHSMTNLLGDELYEDDFIAEVQILTGLAVEGRMRGIQLPVMTSWGSGNQGLVATIPVYFLGKKWGKKEEEVLRALALSNLIVGKVKSYLGAISSICGTSIAGASGICAGLVYLNGGKDKEVEDGLSLVIGSLSGVICDGAKPGCWAKAMVAVEVGIRASLLALQGVRLYSGDGIVEEEIEKTLLNLENVEKIGMSDIKSLLGSIIQSKNNCRKNLLDVYSKK